MSKTSNRTRILFSMNHIIMGGIEKVLCQYLLALKNLSNIDLSVICKEKVVDTYFLEFFKNNQIRLIDNFTYKKNRFLFIKIGKKKRDFINKIIWFFLKFKGDIFIDFANFSYLEEFKEINKKKLAWFHGSTMVFNAFFQNKIEKNIYDKIVCLSENFKQDFISTNPLLAEQITSIYNPIDIAQIRELGNQETSMTTNFPYFIAVQRLDNFDKDVKTIIEGFNQYSQNDKITKLYIVGDGPDKKQLMELAKNNSNIIFTGKVNNPYPLIKNAQALILSSTKKIGEGFGLVLLEAQTLKTLAISSDVKSSIKETLLNGKAGCLFEAENPKSLAEKLNYIKDHPEECNLLKQTATQNLDRFNINNAIKKFVELCNISEENNHA